MYLNYPFNFNYDVMILTMINTKNALIINFAMCTNDTFPVNTYCLVWSPSLWLLMGPITALNSLFGKPILCKHCLFNRCFVFAHVL